MRPADNALARIQKALDEATVLPFIALQYALCETGHPRRRWDPRELLAAMRGHVEGDDRPELATPLEPRPRLFVDPGVTKTGAAQHAETIAAGYESRLASLPSWPRARAVRTAAETAVDSLDLDSINVTSWEARGEIVGGRVMLPAPSLIARGTLRGHSVGVWFANDLDWLYPDDIRFWRFLALCLEEGRFALIIARKVTIAVMALLKRINGIALQLHQVVGPPVTSARPELKRIVDDLPPLLLPGDIRSHQAITRGKQIILSSQLDRAPDHALLTAAADRGFTSGPVTPQDLLDWQGAVEMQMSGFWIGQLRRWDRLARFQN
jgi:hypothetical protein